jgi:hypothetical protein
MDMATLAGLAATLGFVTSVACVIYLVVLHLRWKHEDRDSRARRGLMPHVRSG